jgi:hypothetical protein
MHEMRSLSPDASYRHPDSWKKGEYQESEALLQEFEMRQEMERMLAGCAPLAKVEAIPDASFRGEDYLPPWDGRSLTQLVQHMRAYDAQLRDAHEKFERVANECPEKEKRQTVYNTYAWSFPAWEKRYRDWEALQSESSSPQTVH